MAIRTIFSMAEDCSRGERRGWEEFVCNYAEIAEKLLKHYFPTLQPEIDAHVTAVFQRARGDQNQWFRSIKFSNEREFLMFFRDLVFAYGRENARVPVPKLSLDQVSQIMTDLPVLEREMLWLFIKGYNAQQIAAIMLNAIATAEGLKKVADERLSQVLPGNTADAFNVSCRVLMQEAENKRSDQCLPVKTFNNMVNGQITWRERELAEEHLKECFYCLDCFTSFQEMIRLRVDARPLPENRLAQVLAALDLPAARGRGVLGKLLSKA